jgi:hypothetical protein
MESVGRAVALRARGRLAEAVPTLVAAARRMATGFLTSMFYLGEVFDGLLEAEELSVLGEVLAAPAPLGLPLLRGELERLRGLLHARRGELVEAEAALGRSADNLRAAGNPFALARNLLDEAGVLMELGLETRAAPILHEARGLFSGVRARPWIERTVQGGTTQDAKVAAAG